MNERIRELALEAGYLFYDLTETDGIKIVETDEADEWAQLERFAASIAAEEREACALMVERGVGDWRLGKKVATAIRARGGDA